VQAATTGDQRTAALALLTNPLVGQWVMAEELLGTLLEAGRDHLPRFAATA